MIGATRRPGRPSRPTALAVLGLAMTAAATACTPGPGPGASDDLVDTARAGYTAMAEDLHTVIMQIEPAEWAVSEGRYGAHPTGCQIDPLTDDPGYRFSAVRVLDLPGRDRGSVLAAAQAGFAAAGITPDATVGDQAGGLTGRSDAARTIVAVDAESGRVSVTSETECRPGSAAEIAEAVYGEETLPDDVWRRLPATEGPASVPQFSFPPGGPLYDDESGAPVDPQPPGTSAPVPAS